MNLNSTDKASIQQRMYQQAADIYRQHLGRDISSLEMFDPLVLMVINACASEFQLFSEEMSFAKTRMLKHLAKMLTPESYTGPRPAHGIVHAPTTESGEVTNRLKDSFFYTNPQSKKLYFSPTADFTLTNGNVSYIAGGNAIYGITNSLNKQEVLSTELGKQLPVTSVWLGIDAAIQSLNTLNLYFDVPLSAYVNKLPALLGTSRSFYGDVELKTHLGLETVNNIGGSQLTFNAIHQHEDEVMRFYQGQFLQIDLSEHKTLFTTGVNEFPEELKSSFLLDDLTKRIKGKGLHWIRIDFAQSVFEDQRDIQTFLRQLTCQTNCFPVMNYLVQSKSFALNERINLFPLKCGEAYFYGVEEARSSQSGKFYTEQSFSQFLEEDTMTTKQQTMVYALRRSAVQRFDTRTSVEWMENILQLIREETLVYNALGKNILTHNLKTIQKAVNDINAKIYQTKAEEGNEEQIFIALPKVDKNEYVVVRYWATNGTEARNIPGGEPLKLNDSTHGSYDEGAIRLLTTTVDGRNPVSGKDALEEFRSAIIVKDKIVTKEDIRQYCSQNFNEEIVSCTVGKSSRISTDKSEGFQRIIAVELELVELTSPEHRAYIENKLTTELNTRCSGILPIVVTTNS